MHSLLTRLNAIFAFALSVMAAVAFSCFATTVLNDFSTEVSTLSAHNVVVKSIPNYVANGDRHDLGFVNFDITADLSPIFNWNVKQLFVYLTAEYQTENNAFNQVVLWDKIVHRTDMQVIDVKSANTKYYFWDDGSGLKGNKNVTLRLYWNVIPNAGYLHLSGGRGQLSLNFPTHYSSAKM